MNSSRLLMLTCNPGNKNKHKTTKGVFTKTHKKTLLCRLYDGTTKRYWCGKVYPGGAHFFPEWQSLTRTNWSKHLLQFCSQTSQLNLIEINLEKD